MSVNVFGLITASRNTTVSANPGRTNNTRWRTNKQPTKKNYCTGSPFGATSQACVGVLGVVSRATTTIDRVAVVVIVDVVFDETTN
jgi:hypothetical protein